MIFPPEVFEQILFELPLPDLMHAAQVSRLFNRITQWHLVNEQYIKRWMLSFQENFGETRYIPLDLEETRKQLSEGNGFYVFDAKIQPISWVNEILHIDVVHLNLRVLTFGLRFLDHGDVKEDELSGPTSQQTTRSRGSSPDMFACDGRCGQMIGFKILPWTTTPAARWRMSPTHDGTLLWKIELLPNDNSEQLKKREGAWNRPRYFDTVRVTVSLEAIKNEYVLREAVRRAREKHPGSLCVCEYLVFPVEHQQEFWASESGYLTN